MFRHTNFVIEPHDNLQYFAEFLDNLATNNILSYTRQYIDN